MPSLPMAPQHWAIIPAAGVGTRMGGTQPKQYLPLRGQVVLEWSVQLFLQQTYIAEVILVVTEQDQQWRGLPCIQSPRLRAVVGGATRADSVRAGMAALRSVAKLHDWVWVHDAARPCITVQDLDALRTAVQDDAVGGLLAVPLTDTIKRADAMQRVSTTVPRTDLWRALTPQVFRFGVLQQALAQAQQQAVQVTDEATAIELAGGAPRLVAGRADNIKITEPADMQLAESILQSHVFNLTLKSS